MGSHYSLASALIHQLEPDSCAADKAEISNSALSSGHCSAIRILLWSTQRHREGGETLSFFLSFQGESALESRRERRRTKQRVRNLSTVSEPSYRAAAALVPPFTPSLDSHCQLLTEKLQDYWKRVERTLQPSLHANASAQRWNAELLKKRNVLMTAVSQSFQLDKVLTNRADKTYWEGGRRTK